MTPNLVFIGPSQTGKTTLAMVAVAVVLGVRLFAVQ
jgi:Holliday junction resolvasome RuvABC ATP-dependent DNA helicase subunit